MKKVVFMFLMALTVLSVVACGGVTTTQAPTTQAPTTAAPTTAVDDTEAPVITGADNITVYVGADFNPLTGVTATDNVDGDITSSITITGTVDTSATGTYFLKYSVTDEAGNKREVTRYVYVEVDPALIGDEMVPNGDFSLGWEIWTTTTGLEGGNANFAVVDGELEIEITSVSGGLWEPRLENQGIAFEQGKTYQVSFDARAVAPRSVHVQVGELLSSAPWFDNFKEGQTTIFDLTTTMATYSFKFNMTEATNENGSLIFEFGTVGTENLLTTVYLDNVVIVEADPDPDATAPTILGATNLTLETGTPFDPLEGVTAVDNLDGDVTDKLIVNGTVNTNTPGEYTITYVVWDEAGNITSKSITITVVDLIFNATTEIVDGTFDTTTEIVPEVQDTPENGYADITAPDIWYYYVAGWDGAAASFAVTDAKAVIEVTAAGGNDWGVMLKQKGISLVQGETYKLSFTASATVDRDIVAKITDFYAGNFSITSTATTYEFIFTYTGENTDMARLMFLLGNTTSYAAGVVTIDDVEVSVLQQDPLLVNGLFDVTGWNTWAQDWGAVGGITIDVVNGQLVADVTSVSEQFWSVQLFQEGIVLVPGTEYTITFDAKSSVARDMSLVLITDVENRQTFNLTTDMQTFTFTFIYSGTATTGKIDFELGNISAASVPSIVTFDNIAMTDGTNPVTIVNGTFDQVIGWNTWAQDWGATGAIDISIVDQQLNANVTAVSEQFWSVQLFQEGIEVANGNVYIISFQAKADVARDFNVVFIDGNGVEFRQTFNLTTDMQTFTFTFLYNGTASTGKLDFEFGNISVESVPALITMDNIYFYRSFNPFGPE